MKNGRFICDQLKKVRLDIARANGIEYAPRECHHEGDCAGTCPACESEMRFLEREIARRRSHGKAALIAGVSLGLMRFLATSCDQSKKLSSNDPMGESIEIDMRIDKEGQESGEIVDTAILLGEIDCVDVSDVPHQGDSVDECSRSVDNMPVDEQ